MHKIIYSLSFISVGFGVLSVLTFNPALICLSISAFIIENLLLVFSGSVYFSKKAKMKKLIQNGEDLISGVEAKNSRLFELQERAKNDGDELALIIEEQQKQKEKINRSLREMVEFENRLEEKKIELAKQLEDSTTEKITNVKNLVQ